MISGNIGSAALRRLDYTVIGDTVNTAQRLQSAAGKCQIVITEESYEKVKLSFNCQNRQHRPEKQTGAGCPVRGFELVSLLKMMFACAMNRLILF